LLLRLIVFFASMNRRYALFVLFAQAELCFALRSRGIKFVFEFVHAKDIIPVSKVDVEQFESAEVLVDHFLEHNEELLSELLRSQYHYLLEGRFY